MATQITKVSHAPFSIQLKGMNVTRYYITALTGGTTATDFLAAKANTRYYVVGGFIHSDAADTLTLNSKTTTTTKITMTWLAAGIQQIPVGFSTETNEIFQWTKSAAGVLNGWVDIAEMTDGQTMPVL